MTYRIGVAGTDARTLLSALTISTATSEKYPAQMEGSVIRGTSGMRAFNSEMQWPVCFIDTEDNSAKGYAKAVCENIRAGHMDCVLPMPEKLLFDGFVDECIDGGYGDRVIGLTQDASFVEGDKVGCKYLCDEYDIPVAEWFDADAKDFEKIKSRVLQLLDRYGGAVLKYPYSASGKGARVILDVWQIREVYDQLIADYKASYKEICGKRARWPLLIEARMSGAEISFTALVDGYGHYQVLPTAMDYPERYSGPASASNPITGGMGSVSPHPLESEALRRMAGEQIIEPFVKALREKGHLRPCVLYPGCFVSFDAEGKPLRVRMCEMNIRPGEPEFQPVCRRLRNPGALLKACVEGNLDQVLPEVRENQLSMSMALVTGPGGEMGRPGYPWGSVRGEPFIFNKNYLDKKKIQLIPSALSYNEESGQFESDGSRVAYIAANGAVNETKSASAVAQELRTRLLSAHQHEKVKVRRQEDGGNRLQVREDIGSQYGIAEQLFNSH